MKKLISVLFLMAVLSLSTSTTHAQAPNFLWVAQAGGWHVDRGVKIATDGAGNIIVTGDFNQTATFGDTTLTSVRYFDIFIAKYDAEGNFLWVAQIGGMESELPRGIATDGAGNSLVTGGFKGTVTFGDTTLSAGLDNDIFIAKYDANGNFLWVAQAGGTSGVGGWNIATDGSGNSIVTGAFSGTATFGDDTLTSAGFSDIFIAKIDANGNFLWVAQAGGTDSQGGIGIATDGSGNSIVTGRFSGTVTFDITTLTSAGYDDIFIAKYDAEGNFLWAVQAGGTDGDTGDGIATDGSGNITMTGKFSSTATFGDTTLTSTGDYDIFIAKYDANGNFLWAAQAGGMEPQYLSELPRGIATDGSDNVIVTGGFAGTATFGNITLTSAGYYDVFIAKYDADGNFLWVVQAGGTDDGDVGNGIATDGLGNIIVTGSFYQTSIFGDTTLTSAGYSDIFIAKLGPGGVTGIEEEFTLPRSFNLWQNYPNPFNPITRIKYSIPESGLVTLKIYDLLGRVIKTLVNEFQEPNTYSVDFDASELSSGIYFYNLSVSAWLSQDGQSGNFSETRKMILMK